MMKFTFKKEAPTTGLAGVGNPYPDTAIKLKKKVVGQIIAPTWQTTDHKWRVGFMVEAETGRWDWRFLKQRFDTEPEVRIWLNERIEKLIALGLHSEEEDD